MSKIFRDYAHIYDIIYRQKDYPQECNFLEKIFCRYSKRKVNDILDVACGTGNHIVILARKGFNVFAQDMSREMLAIAKQKAAAKRLNIRFMPPRSMQSFRHKRKFDAIIAMFSSVDYLTDIKHLKAALNNIRTSLKKGGIFTFDFWNKPYVLKHYSPLKKKVFVSGDKKVVRISETSLDKKNSIANIKFICNYFENGRRLHTIEEAHRMKFYDIEEMMGILDGCGFEVLACFPFLKLQCKDCSKDWNISIVATPRN